jgi:Rrf2 family protein
LQEPLEISTQSADLEVMLTSSRFVVAIHALIVLARSEGKGPVCSSVIAESVHTNPVVIRRLMAELERANLVNSFAGRAGGFVLSRAAATISLADIFSAVEDENMFRMHKHDPDNDCPIGAQLGEVLAPSLKAAELAMSGMLGKTTLSSVVASIH